MKDLIENLNSRLGELKLRLGELALEGDFEKLRAITEQAKELERGRDFLSQAERCISGAERKLAALLRPHVKAAPTVLRIALCWSKIGLPGADEVIEERMAADAMPRLFERLAAKMGPQILERAGKVLHGDRPMLSQRPSRDWVNPNTGEPYAAKSIGNTGWHVITHSSTMVKIEQIEAVSHGLGFPGGAIKAQAVARQSAD